MEIKKLSIFDIERKLDKEFDTIKENSEYWSEDDEKSINFELQHKKEFIAVDDLLEIFENELISYQEEITSKHSNEEERRESTLAYKIIENVIKKIKQNRKEGES